MLPHKFSAISLSTFLLVVLYLFTNKEIVAQADIINNNKDNNELLKFLANSNSSLSDRVKRLFGSIDNNNVRFVIVDHLPNKSSAKVLNSDDPSQYYKCITDPYLIQNETQTYKADLQSNIFEVIDSLNALIGKLNDGSELDETEVVLEFLNGPSYVLKVHNLDYHHRFLFYIPQLKTFCFGWSYFEDGSDLNVDIYGNRYWEIPIVNNTNTCYGMFYSGSYEDSNSLDIEIGRFNEGKLRKIWSISLNYTCESVERCFNFEFRNIFWVDNDLYFTIFDDIKEESVNVEMSFQIND